MKKRQKRAKKVQKNGYFSRGRKKCALQLRAADALVGESINRVRVFNLKKVAFSMK